MIRQQSSKIVAAVALSLIGAYGDAAFGDEVSELRSAVQALQKRIDDLEAKSKEAEETNDRQTDLIAKTRSGYTLPNRFTWKGDFRYRNENIEQQYVAGRNRDRIRLRTGFTAQVNDAIRTEVQIATAEAGDPRSSNQTLTGTNTRKSLYLDLAYFEWQAAEDWRFTGGKMRYPWVRPAAIGYFFDNDINPEGLAVNYAHGDLFASAFYNLITERGPTGVGAASVGNADSNMAGAQLGYRLSIGAASRLTVAGALFDFNAVQNRNVFFVTGSGSTETGGNTTRTTGCYAGATLCLAYDYRVYEAFAEYTTAIGRLPLAVHFDYANNAAADNGLDTAYSAGVLLGRASEPHTWEVGYIWEHHDRDSLFGLYTDSDYGNGATDSEGSMIRAGYAPARNWTLNGTWFLNKTNIDVPVLVSPAIGSVRDRDYKRLQVDLNFRF